MEKKTVKTAPAKAEAVKEEVKKVEPAKVEVKKAEPVKAEAKKAPAKKAPAKKAVAEKKEASTSVFVQFGGNETAVDTVVANVKKAFEAEGHKASTIKELQVYVKPEEGAAYYVINQKYTGKVNLF